MLEALQTVFKGCKEELMIVQEEKERLKIKVKDLIEIVDITNKNVTEIVGSKEVTSNIQSEIVNCKECDIPMSSIIENTNHINKHKTSYYKSVETQVC